MVGMAIGADHAAMVEISAMSPTLWLFIPVGNILCFALTARVADAVGRSADAGFISIPMFWLLLPFFFCPPHFYPVHPPLLVLFW